MKAEMSDVCEKDFSYIIQLSCTVTFKCAELLHVSVVLYLYYLNFFGLSTISLFFEFILHKKLNVYIYIYVGIIQMFLTSTY